MTAYNPPSGETDPNAVYKGKNVAAGIQGSRIPPKAVENPQRELVALIKAAGLSPTNDDLTQAAQAVRILAAQAAAQAAAPAAALWHVGTATVPQGGTTGALVVADLAPAITSYADKLPLYLTFPAGVADGASIAIRQADGTLLPALALQRNDGSPIRRADLPPGAPTLCALSGTTALRLTTPGYAEVQRIVLNPVLWVRPDGDDANDGSANDPAHAFKTIAGALAKGLSQYNFASSALTIRLGAPGVYPSPQYIPRGIGTVIILGDAAAPASYLISGAGSPAQGSLQAASSLQVTGCTIQNTGTASHTVAATTGADIVLTNCILQATQGTTGAHAFASGGAVTLVGACTITGNASAALWGESGGSAALNSGAALTFSGNPTFSVATIVFRSLGRAFIFPGASFSGAVSGPKYSGSGFSILNTNGYGPNNIPGSSPGSADATALTY